ncbi:hypothetical protein BGM19_07040 [Streptomyces agglomeratus]|uniref:DUF2637 domain-containing protein n=1 Tax=Streptomyces agglomeratus TaxID=285458 RepID=UPI00086CD1BA|nr:DUF2637 domain-containing protein [Streptomyces agglomeratus]OEJ57760.1 hypothetical protein BGM19_07040 [Streptomyces agglomeratus]
MKNIDPSRALAIGAGCVIIALTATAFWLSYAHLAEVALGHGLGDAEVRAWAWPACLDLFIVAGEIMWLRAALAHRVDLWAIGLTAVGSAGSIILNVAGVTGDRDPGAVPLLDYVVAAVPPTAALLAFGALMRQVHQALAGHAEPIKLDVIQLETTPEVVTPPVICAGPGQLLPVQLPEREVTAELVMAEVPGVDPWAHEFPFQTTIGQPPGKAPAVPASEARRVVTEPLGLTPNELRQRARRLHRQVVKSTGRGVTIDRLREEFGLSRREATELRRDVVTGGQS